MTRLGKRDCLVCKEYVRLIPYPYDWEVDGE